MRNEINFLDKRRDQEDTWLGRSNARIRDCGIQNDGKTREHHLHVAFLLCPTCVFQRGQKSRLFTRGSGSGHGNGPSAVSSRRPFQKFRRRHTDSPASSYELASSAQSSFRFFRMEWPRLIPEPPRVAWFVERADGGIRCCCRACSYENWDREAIPGNGISLEERRTVLLWTGVFIIIHLFRYTEKKKKRKICSRSV